ncbi:hypothetical protein QVD17_14753 [Tagetes erecta]|uniref:Uncharacterized protein n=1 Tax=Tagetes erecta TaxID=13708 RepID=A0AAD8KUN0_TARER|nr:hypothetical protein QVD17_14753 [Tagetes erecta]
MNSPANLKSRPKTTTPVMRFPRTKSRASNTSKTNANYLFAQNETSQEPSSPKVTCTGQVRVNRVINEQTTTTAAVRRCKWFQMCKTKTRWLRRLWKRELCFSVRDWCRESENLQELKRVDDELITKCGKYRSSSLANKLLESKRREEEEDETEGVNGDIWKENREDEGFVKGDEGVKVEPARLNRCKSVRATR